MNNAILRRVRAAFPVWWFSPARDVAEGAGKVAEEAQVAQKKGEAGEGGEVSTKVESKEGYDVVLPKTPALREDKLGRPPLQRPSSPSYAELPLQTVLPHAEFTESELSLLKERAVTESTPGRLMRVCTLECTFHETLSVYACASECYVSRAVLRVALRSI